MSTNNVEHIRRWLAEAVERKERARAAGDYAAFQTAETDEKNYRQMLAAWSDKQDDAV